MEPEGNLLPNILLLLFLISCNAFFTVSGTSIISLNDNKIRKLAQEGDKKAALIAKLINRPSEFLASIQVCEKISGLLATAFASITFTRYILYATRDTGIHQSILLVVSAVVAAAALSYCLLVFGELVPKRAAVQNYEKIAYAVAPLFFAFEAMSRPFIRLLSASSNGILRLMGIDPDNEPDEVTEEEIRMLVDAGGERGSIEESEKEMINNIFEFDDRTVDQMMTHRTEIIWVSQTEPLGEIVNTAIKSGRSRIPVCEDDIDSILGILYVKDLLSLVTDGVGGDFRLSDYIREPLYVLESNSCMAVLSQFRAKKIQMAIVVDEYGGTSGLVTMEDLLESIVGNIQDEYDDEDDEIFMLGENRYLVDGLTSLEDVDKFFGLNLSEESEFDTIGGYIIDRLGRIPAEDEHPSVEAGGYRFIVNDMDERRVAKLEVERDEALESAGHV